MEVQLNIIGGLLIALAIIHLVFPKRFQWKEELPRISLINRQIIQVHTFFIALTLLLMGLLCVTSAHDVVTTSLGKHIALGLGIFWLCRLLIQLFGYSSLLWKGKRFETVIHIVFIFLWTYLSTVFFIVALKW